MAKTLVIPKHDPGPAVNGHDECYARAGNNGECPGVQTAAWLNSIGEDDQQFGSTDYTCGQVRDNWIKSNNHIQAKDIELARLKAEQRSLSARLRIVTRL